MQQQESYSIIDVAHWAESNFVTLPTVQRGFVWRPHQIENLWDSLLRGYPIGAFVLSPRGNEGYEILDGQQRATAICLGFAHKTFRDSHKQIKVFIDLDKPNADDHRKYIFRVITQSHPWGYQKNEPSKTLNSDQIRKAMDLYDSDDPLNIDLDSFFPFDAGFPIPLHFFLDAVKNKIDAPQLYAQCTAWVHWEKIKLKWQQQLASNTDEKLIENINAIWQAVGHLLMPTVGQKIPALYLHLDQFLKEEQDEAIDAADEIENIFVRLNAGGTQLSGEELNYSILKAHLSRETQDIIEEACKVLFRPARFITIAYRLFQFSGKGAQQNDALSMRIKAKQFQKSVSKDANAFEQFLLQLAAAKDYDGKPLLEYVKSVLEYRAESQPYGLPFLIYSKISDTAPELMFLLLYRIMVQKDSFPNTNKGAQETHRKALGIFTLLLWFGRGENHKDHSKLLNNIWPLASKADQSTFWSVDIIERASIRKALIPFPNNENKEGIYLEKILRSSLSENTNLFKKLEAEEGGAAFIPFFQKAIYNRDLLIYAQRGFLEQYFRQEQYRLEDTNVPFDWDHISPNNFVSGKKLIPQIVKDWYGTIGNFRAWPYALNRMDSDNCPAYKLKPLNSKHFDTDSDYTISKGKWQKFIKTNSHLIKSTSELDKKLLDWSFCEPSWTRCASDNLKKDWRPVVQEIMHRNIAILKNWYYELRIETLKSNQSTFQFEDILLKSNWKKAPLNIGVIDAWFDEEVRENWISSSFKLDQWKLRFYFYFPKEGQNFLEANELAFGLFNESGDNFLREIAKKSKEHFDNKDFNWIEKKFTLISCSKASIGMLLDEIQLWMQQILPQAEHNEALKNKLSELLVKKFTKET